MSAWETHVNWQAPVIHDVVTKFLREVTRHDSKDLVTLVGNLDDEIEKNCDDDGEFIVLSAPSEVLLEAIKGIDGFRELLGNVVFVPIG